MTDTMGALQALNQTDSDLRQQALADFYQRWRDQPLVINKWLSLQSTAELPSTFEHVKALTHHDAFDYYNPNKVYALLCGFGDNWSSLHAGADDGAYQFLAQQVIQIDQHNPQVAARVLQPLMNWQPFDSTRAKRMQSALQTIANESAISTDVYEVVTKSLPS